MNQVYFPLEESTDPLAPLVSELQDHLVRVISGLRSVERLTNFHSTRLEIHRESISTLQRTHRDFIQILRTMNAIPQNGATPSTPSTPRSPNQLSPQISLITHGTASPVPVTDTYSGTATEPEANNDPNTDNLCESFVSHNDE